AAWLLRETWSSRRELLPSGPDRHSSAGMAPDALPGQVGSNRAHTASSDATTVAAESDQPVFGCGVSVAPAPRGGADPEDSGPQQVARGAPVPSWLTATRLPTVLALRHATPTTPPPHAQPGDDPDVPAHAPAARHPAASVAVRSRPGGRRSSPWPSST